MKTSPRSWLLLACTLAVLGVVLPALLLSTYQRSIDTTSLLLRLVVLEYAALRLALKASSTRVTPMQSLFWLFVYVSLGVAPLAQLVTGMSSALAKSVTAETLDWTSVIVLLGCTTYDLACITYRNDKLTSEVYRSSTEPETVRLRKVSLLSLAMSAIYVTETGLPTFFANRQDFNDASSAAFDADSGQALRGLISSLGSAPILVCLVSYILILKRSKTSLANIDRLIALTLFIANIVVNNPISNSRYWTLSVLVGIGLALVGTSPRIFGVLLLLGTLASIVIFPVSDINRTDVGTNTTVGATNVWEVISIKDYDQFTMLANTVSYVSQIGLSGGQQMLGVALFWVPRSAWPGKPLDTGVAIGQWMQQTNVNLSSPLWAEFYVNFGYVGVVLGFLLVGRASAQADARYWASHVTGREPSLTAFFAVLAGYEFILLRGSLLQAMGRLAILLLTVILLTRFGARQGPKTTSGSRRPPRQFLVSRAQERWSKEGTAPGMPPRGTLPPAQRPQRRRPQKRRRDQRQS